MAKYSIRAPDGHVYELEGPEDAKDEDLIAAVKEQFPDSVNPIGDTPSQDSPNASSIKTPVAPKTPTETVISNTSGASDGPGEAWMTPDEEKEYLRQLADPSFNANDINAWVSSRAIAKGLPPFKSNATDDTLKEYRTQLAAAGGKSGPVTYSDWTKEVDTRTPEMVQEDVLSKDTGPLSQVLRSAEEAWNYGGIGALGRGIADLTEVGSKAVNDMFPGATKEEKEKLRDHLIQTIARTNRDAATQGVEHDGTIPWLMGQLYPDVADLVPFGKAAKATTVGKRVLEKGAEGAVANTAFDVASQGLDVAQGQQDSFNPTQTLLAGLIGAGAHGATQALAEGVGRLARGGEPKAPQPTVYEQLREYGVAPEDLPSGVAPEQALTALQKMRQLQEEASSFKGKTNVSPEDVFPRKPTAEEWAAALNAPEAGPVRSEPSSPEPYVQDLAPNKTIDPEEVLRPYGLTAGHFNSPEEMQQAVQAILKKEQPVEPVSYEGQIRSDVPSTSDGSISKKEAEQLFPAKPEKQNLREWEKSLKTQVAEWNKKESPKESVSNVADSVPNEPAQTAAPVSNTPEPTGDIYQRLTDSINEAGKLSKEQAQMLSRDRSAKLAEARQALYSGSGEDAFKIAMSKLKGAAAKPDYSGIKENFTQPELDSLFNDIKTNPNLRGFEPINAYTGLSKMLDGRVPSASELSVLQRVLPKETIQAALKNRSTLSKTASFLGQAANLPRTLMATMDLSAPFRQGVFLVGTKEFWQAWPSMFKEFANGLKKNDEIPVSERGANWQPSSSFIYDEIRQRPTYDLMEQSGLQISNPDGFHLSDREEQFMSRFAEKIPGFGRIVKASENAYSGFLNKLRADTFDNLVEQSRQFGIDFNSEPEKLKDIARFVNSATGRADTGKLNKYLAGANAILFSPRLIASRLDLLAPVRYVNPSVNPVVRRAYVKNLLSFASIVGTVATLAYLNGADVETDPRSSQFAKVKVGNTRYDIAGGFGQYITLAARLQPWNHETKTIKGDLRPLDGKGINKTKKDVAETFVENKFAPLPGFVRDALQGTDPVGQPFDVSTANPMKNSVTKMFVPLFAQDLYSVMQDQGAAKGAVMAVPGIFGAGMQTFDENKPKEKPEDASNN